jgi:8-amino-7-oxononanoate synthase
MTRELDRELGRELAAREQAGLLRRLERPAPRGKGDVQGGGKGAAGDPIDFATNDTLGFATRGVLVAAARAALERHGTSGRAARLLGGGCDLDFEVEQAAASWLGAQAALLFPTGFQANLGVVTALAGPSDSIFSDRANHASLIDAARLSRARVHVYEHLDLEHLERLLRASPAAGRRLVVTESVFSMDGDLAPLRAIDALCERFGAWLVVDEAHSVGLLGREGAGAVAAQETSQPRVAARIATGGKALGASGALAVGSAALRATLVNHARSFVYTTSPPPSTAAALLAAIERCRASTEEREQALSLARRLAAEIGADEPAAAIVPVRFSSGERMLAAQADLRARGFQVAAVRPPTAPTPRLRVVSHAFNTQRQVEELASLLKQHLDRPPQSGGYAQAPRKTRPLFVAGTDTGVGKTLVSALLLRSLLGAGGQGARYWKPVQTGPESDTAVVMELAGASEHEVLAPRYAFELAASPHEAARAEGARIDPAQLRAALAQALSSPVARPLVIELAGGLLVPLTDDWTQADWLASERASAVLVARSGLGTLNHTLLSLEALRARNVEVRALFLVGKRHDSNRETLRRLGGTAVFEVPWFEELDTARIDAWIHAHQLGALFLP